MNKNVTVSDWMDAPIDIGDNDEFAIGDVHGVTDGLIPLLDKIQTVNKQTLENANLTFLGDLIDRGPDSLGALKIWSQSAQELGFKTVYRLLGNHEIMMLLSFEKSFSGASAFDNWMRNGGQKVILQSGLDFEWVVNNRWEAMTVLKEAIGSKVLDCLNESLTHRIVGNLVFVHAGVDPTQPMDKWFSKQKRLNIMEDNHYAWIRFDFLGHEGKFDQNRFIVHGHTPETGVLNWKSRDHSFAHRRDGFRLNLDSGSFDTGQIACAQFRTGQYRVFLSQK